MKPLVIELIKGSPRQFQSLGWKTQDGFRRQFYALDQSGKPLIVTLRPAMPEFYDPVRRVAAVFSCDPFPEAVCIEVSTCRLLAPPCYESTEDLEKQRPCHSTFEPWKEIYMRAHNQALTLEPADDVPLQQRLDRWLSAMCLAYEQEAAAWRDRIKQVTTSSLEKLGFKAEAERAVRLAELREQLAIVESENPIDSVPCKGRLKLTFADVKQGHEGIRDAWMQEDWAMKHGHDLRVMFNARAFFRGWLEKHTGTPANIIDATSRPTIQRRGIAPPDFGEKYEQAPRFLEACALVGYRARFADTANSVVFLADFELREELTAQEIVEVAKLKIIAQPAQVERVASFEQSPNYRQLYWNDGGKKEQANLSKTQAAAFAALHKARGFTLAREEWRQEIYGDEPPNDFRPDKIFQYKDGRRVCDSFIEVDGDRYRLAIEP